MKLLPTFSKEKFKSRRRAEIFMALDQGLEGGGGYHISRGLKITRSLENLVTEDRGK